MTDMFDIAYQEYVRRRSGGHIGVQFKDSVYHRGDTGYELPEGEEQNCCSTHKFDATHFVRHLRSIEHVANIYGLDFVEFRRYVVRRRITATINQRVDIGKKNAPRT